MNQDNNSKNNNKKTNKKRADLKTRKEKYQAKQNSCAANNTGVFSFHTESSFQQNKIKLYFSV